MRNYIPPGLREDSNDGCVQGLVFLFFLFLILKLCEAINWSWWWVTAPIWIIPAIVIAVYILIWIAKTLKGE